MTTRTFDSWLRAHAGRADPIGDLARDYITDCADRGIESMTSRQLADSLSENGACANAHAALASAVQEWRETL